MIQGLLPTTVVGSYSVPEWLERLKTVAARVDQLVLEFARKGLDDLRLIREYAWPSTLVSA